MPDPTYLVILDELAEQHAAKSGGYGSGLDPYANFAGVAAVHMIATDEPRLRFAYPIERMVEKLVRAKSLIAQGRLDELGEELCDVAGLAICAESMRRADLREAGEGV